VKRLAPAVLTLFCLLEPGAVRASEPALQARMNCRLEAGSGRLLCTVSFTEDAARAVVWSDALVVAEPRAVRALKSRVTSQSDRPSEVVLAFVLQSGEGGRIDVIGRAVSCPRAPRTGTCRAETAHVGYEFRPAS
jgi:hypothetical protein